MSAIPTPGQQANYLAETDFLAEAGAILRGETRKIATIEHLKALEQLVRRAHTLLESAYPYAPFSKTEHTREEDWEDWLREAAKVSR